MSLKDSRRFVPGMTTGLPDERPHGLDPRELADGEIVLRHWNAPGGIGVLTNRRCILLGHPHPIHRPIAWSTSLDEVKSIEVQQLAAVRESMNTTVSMPMGVTGPTIAIPGDWVAGSFAVLVDGVGVLHGTPRQCEEVQRWIGEARAQRRPGPGDRTLRTS